MGVDTPRPEVSTPVGRALAALGIPQREFRHPGPVTSLAQAAEAVSYTHLDVYKRQG